MPLFNQLATFDVLLEAVAEEDLDVVVTIGANNDPDALAAPSNVRVHRWLPLRPLLANCDAVVCHGGSGTTLAALHAGLPLVLVPQGADQFENALACEKAGAAQVLRPDVLDSAAVRDAVLTVIGETSADAYRGARPSPGRSRRCRLRATPCASSRPSPRRRGSPFPPHVRSRADDLGGSPWISTSRPRTSGWPTPCPTSMPSSRATNAGPTAASTRTAPASPRPSRRPGDPGQPGVAVPLQLPRVPARPAGRVQARCGPVNVNYRYLDEELVYLVDNSDSEVLVFHSSLGERVARVRDRLDRVRLLVVVRDDDTPCDFAVDFDELLATHDPQPRRTPDPNDVYMLYTGGTTGMPKGVMYRNGVFCGGLYLAISVALPGIDAPTSVDDVPRFVEECRAAGPMVSIPAAR